MLRGIRIGELDRKVTIKQKSVTSESLTNEEVITYSTLRSVFMKRLGPKSNESFEANQQVAVSTVQYFGRYYGDYDETMILDDDGIEYHIKGIEVMDRKSGVKLTCEKRDNE
jgi:hypothetical protein